jgi:hypothetical protein
MLSKSRTELEADYLVSEADYRELVRQTLVLGRCTCPKSVEYTREVDAVSDQRRSALRECNRIFGLLQRVL